MDKTWDDVAKTIKFSLEPSVEKTLSQLTQKARILDLGCGYGRISQKIWEMGYKNIIGYDCSRKMIERGHKIYPNLNLNINPSDIIPEPSESFDLVILCAVLTSIPNQNIRQKIISESFRVLKIDGAISVWEFAVVEGKSYSNDGTFCSSFGVTMKHFNKTELEKELECFSDPETKIFDAESLDGNPAKAISFHGKKHK